MLWKISQWIESKNNFLENKLRKRERERERERGEYFWTSSWNVFMSLEILESPKICFCKLAAILIGTVWVILFVNLNLYFNLSWKKLWNWQKLRNFYIETCFTCENRAPCLDCSVSLGRLLAITISNEKIIG